MHKLYDLKQMLCEELEQYGKKGELTAGSLDVVDKLAQAIKNIDKIIESKDGGSSYAQGGSYAPYSNNMSNANQSYARGNSYDGSYNNMSMDGSYARGRGRNANRDSMGRYASEGGYSRNDSMVAELRGLMNEAPDEQTRQEFQRLIQKLEMM